MSFGAHVGSGHFTIAKSDSPQPQTFYGLYVGTVGDVYVTDVDGVTCVYKGAFGYLAIKGTHVLNATTAADIVGIKK